MTPKDIERFWSHVDRSGECWIWTGSTYFGRYGQFKAKGRKYGAHRVAYELQHGPIDLGLQVCHRCDTPLCVRGEHLFEGTQRENMLDRLAKGRWKGGRPPGSKSSFSRGRRDSKLKADDVRTIRDRFAQQAETKAELARRFGVSHHTIRMILNGTAWRWLT